MKKTKQHDEKFGTYGVSLGQKFVFNYMIMFSLLRGSPGKAIARRLWRLLSTSPNSNIYDFERWGIRFRLNLNSNYMENKIIFNRRTHDKEEVDIFISRMTDGEVFADVGANAGYWSLRLAKAFSKSKILAFEPNPVMLERLISNVNLNNFEKRIKALSYALSDSNGKATLTIEYDKKFGYNYGQGSINEKFISQNIVADDDFESSTSVETRLLTDCLQEQKIKKIDVMKVDIEGHEAAALMPYLRATSPEDLPHTILIEHVSAECWEENVIDYLLENGYKILYNKSINTVLGR